MPRRRNTKPTEIYWLVDVRPATLAAGWHNGLPFYCGKTVGPPLRRLQDHRREAARFPGRDLSARLRDCDELVRVDTMEIVPPEADWAERERQWIRVIRGSFPDVVNKAHGGEGVPGLIHSAETRARLRAVNTGKRLSAEHRAKISATIKGRTFSPETRAKLSAANKGKRPSERTMVAALAFNTGRPLSAEHRAKMRIAHLGVPRSAETRANMRIAQRARYANA